MAGRARPVAAEAEAAGVRTGVPMVEAGEGAGREARGEGGPWCVGGGDAGEASPGRGRRPAESGGLPAGTAPEEGAAAKGLGAVVMALRLRCSCALVRCSSSTCARRACSSTAETRVGRPAASAAVTARALFCGALPAVACCGSASWWSLLYEAGESSPSASRPYCWYGEPPV